MDKRQDRQDGVIVKLATDLDKRFDQFASGQKEWREHMDKRQDRQDGVIVKLAADLDKRFDQFASVQKEWREHTDKRQDRQDGVIVKSAAELGIRISEIKKDFRWGIGIAASVIIALLLFLLKNLG